MANDLRESETETTALILRTGHPQGVDLQSHRPNSQLPREPRGPQRPDRAHERWQQQEQRIEHVENQVGKLQKDANWCNKLHFTLNVVSLLVMLLGCVALFVSINNSESIHNFKDQQLNHAAYEIIGNTECPLEARLVYTGILVSFNGTSAYQCMPKVKNTTGFEIKYNPHSHITQTSEVNYAEAVKYVSSVVSGADNHDVACAVCTIEGRGAIKTIPATTNCTNSWTKEYVGYLMSTGERTVCVDKKMEQVSTYTIKDEEPSLIHVAMSSLHVHAGLTEYNKSEALSCVVCSK